VDLSTFLTALAAIIVIDLVLAGDNAIVIALAARGLPPHLQKRAILWGAVGAIGVRSLMTVVVVWLLKIPGLLLAGGALLVWIGYRLLQPDDEGADAAHPAATTFWGAMRTIVIADAVMGLDNVLAVAGAAHGSYLLVVMGLVISVPIVIWGSTLVLKVVERYPGVVYVGAAVLLFTAVKMMTSEPFLAPTLKAMPWIKAVAYLIIPVVLWLGFSSNHRRFESRIHARLAELAKRLPKGASSAPVMSASAPMTSTSSSSTTPSGELAMLKVLVPVDGSANALAAVRHTIAQYQRHHALQVHLLNVQPPLTRHVAKFVSSKDRNAWHEERATAAMKQARDLLNLAGVPNQAEWVLGSSADEICSAAKRLDAHHIVMGVAKRNSLTRMFESSVTDQVLEKTPVAVEVITGEAVSPWERWAKLASAVGIASGLAVLAID
jgi:YjbE family integral membrane protein